ncbi:uncharacterized protein LOC111267219 isoform X2 [Varroa jacobsoni]|uniref:uncharacterized protein LOC111267219 isoform X2 n=1 Tax=Varroa jacobsoni TaxID=62625 RepID=UPI000BF41F8C|nr:uncharacterized protein LOC111267219 isoform X2 [Varroa jacobsoni]
MWLFSANAWRSFVILFCVVTHCRGGVIPAVIAGGVAAPAALMLFKALANAGKGSSSSTTTTTTTTTTASTTVVPPLLSNDYRYGQGHYYKTNRARQLSDFDDRKFTRYDSNGRRRKGRRKDSRNSVKIERQHRKQQSLSSPTVYNSFIINNNNNLSNVGNTRAITKNNINLSSIENTKSVSRVANNVIANLQFVTKNMQPPSFRLMDLEPSRAVATTVTVNGDALMQGSSYVILSDRAFLIQHLDVHMPPQYKYPSTDITVEITVTDRPQPSHKQNQRITVLFNGEDIRNEFALVLQNKLIPPGTVSIRVNGQTVLGDISLDAITFPSSDRVVNGGPIEPYTFSVEIRENAAPVEGITVTDIRGRPLAGMVDIEVVEDNRKTPHAITLVNGKDSRATYNILIKGKQVSADDLIFKVNGEPQMVIVDFAVSEEVISKLEKSSCRAAVVPSKIGGLSPKGLISY